MLWALLAIALLLIFGWGSYAIRDGRRQPLVANGIGIGLRKTLYILPLLAARVLIGLWLGLLP